MASNNGNGKKAADAAKAASSAQAQAPVQKNNVYSRVGNQQISDVIADKQAAQTQQTSLLSSLDQETEQVQSAEREPSWAQDGAAKEDEEVQIAKKPEAEADKQAAPSTAAPENKAAAAVLTAGRPDPAVAAKDLDGLAAKGSEAEGQLANADAKQVDAVQKKRDEVGTDLNEQQVILAMAEAQNLDEDQKAELILGQKQAVELADIENESGELRALVVAEQLPSGLTSYAEVAAQDAAQKPLSERDTLKNITDEILQISQQVSHHEQLSDPKASIEQKATRLVDLVAYELDIPTRESVSSHPYHALIEDLIFDPAGMMEINRIAGSKRDVRTMGSFAVILWQLCYDTISGRLENMDDKEQVNENKFLGDSFAMMAKRMYTDGMAKPSSV